MKKDDKYSFLILFASFFSLTLSLGIPLSFGIFFKVLVDYFKNQNGKAAVAAVGSICYGVLNLSSPLSSWLYRKYGCRFVVTLGALIASLGLLLSYFATNIWFLYISYGFISGFGFGFIYAPALAVLPDYFEKYRYFATSFATVGSAVGTLVMPQVLLYLIEAYTWRGAMLVVCGLMLQTVVFGLLLKSRSVNQQQQRFWTFEGMLFRDVRFYILCLDSFCFAGCSYIVYTMINAIVVERSLTIELSAVLASIIGFSNITGRIMSSFISQYKQTNRQLFFACVSFLCCVSSFLIVFCVHFWSFAICLTVFGLSYGMRISQVSGVLIDTFGVDKLVGTIGYYFFAGGIGALVIPPLAGAVADYSSISNAILFAAIINLLDSFLCFMVLCYTEYKKKNNIISRSEIIVVEQ